MDFKTIMRVLLWMRPRTFLSLVQKIGRAVRDRRQRGEAVLFITKAMYTRCCVELELLRAQHEEEADASASSDEEDNEEGPQDRDAALQEQDSDDEEDVPAAPAKKRRRGGKKKALSPMELRDKRYFLEYITTTKCRRIPWNKFFGNKDKRRLSVAFPIGDVTYRLAGRLEFPVPPGPCCDNCDPEAFQVETIVLEGGPQLRSGRKQKSPPELENAVREKLNAVRDQIVAADFPMQHFLTGNVILPDDVVDALAKRARLVTSVDTLLQHTRWIQSAKYGTRVVAAIQEVLLEFPDLEKEARETQAAERTKRTLDAAAFKELRSRLVLVFDGCWDAVFSEMEPVPAESGRKRKKALEPRRRCQLFLKLPRENVRLLIALLGF